MTEDNFNPDIHLFPYITKPGRYIGGEQGAVFPAADAAKHLLLIYPAVYEKAVGDPDFQSLYFLLNEIPGLAAERGALFCPDAYERLAKLGQLPFSLETRRPWVDFDYLIFFIADPLDAARIPSMLRNLRDSAASIPSVAVVSTGGVIPRFLAEISDLQLGAISFAGLLAQMAGAIGFNLGDAMARFQARARMPQIVPNTATPHDDLRIPLFAGPLCSPADYPARNPESVAGETLLGLDETGFESVGFLVPRERQYSELPELFSHLSLRMSLAHHHFRVPPITPEVFLEKFAQFRPHFLKSELPLIFPGGERVNEVESHPLAEAGLQALTQGWQVIVLVYRFDQWEKYREGLSSLVGLAQFLGEKCRRHEDRRLVRIRWAPARGLAWTGPLEYNERIEYALSYIHRGALERLPGDQDMGAFDPTDELARQLLLRLGPEFVPILTELPHRFPDEKPANRFNTLKYLRDSADDRGIGLPEPGAPVDLSLSSFLQAESFPPNPADVSPEKSCNLPTLTDVFGRRRRKQAFTRRLSQMPLRRLRVQYAKKESLRFCSHLDVVRMIERVVRRSRLPVAYSSGFHPRPKISFGPPLPLGAISQAEYLDIVLDRDYEPRFAEAFKQRCPTGLSIIKTLALPAQVMSLFERINLLLYRVKLPEAAGDWEARLNEFLAKDSVVVDRVTELETRHVDIRPYVQDLRLSQTDGETILEMELKVSTKGTVRPAEIIAYLVADEHVDPRDLLLERLGVFIQDGQRRISPLDFK